jgi:hypothetical protein
MDAQRKFSMLLIALCVATNFLQAVAASEPRKLKPASVMSVNLDASPLPAARSPYADWPDQGMRPRPDRDVQAQEIFPDQAAAIAATYADEPWRYEAHACAGRPACIHSRAFPSDTGRYCGYYVGGGAAWHGEGRYEHEGTWGWDYHGFCFPKRVALGWWHGLPQSRTGAYQTDGPKLIHHE